MPHFILPFLFIFSMRDDFSRWISFISIGTRLSTDLHAIYQARNSSIHGIIEMGFSFTLVSVIFVHLVSVLCPVLYVLTGYPSSDLWFSPYSVQNALVKILCHHTFSSTFSKKVPIFLCVPNRSSFLSTNPLAFILTVIIISSNTGFMYTFSMKVFTKIYVGVCTNIACFADDISKSVARINAAIDRGISIKMDLKGFVELHLHSYK